MSLNGSPRRLSTDSEEGGFRSPIRTLPTALSPGYDPQLPYSQGQVYHIPITMNEQTHDRYIGQGQFQGQVSGLGQDFISKPTSMSIFRVEKTSRSQKEYSKRTRFLPEFQKSRLKQPEIRQQQGQIDQGQMDRGQRSPEIEEIFQIPAVEPAGNFKNFENQETDKDRDYSRILIKILDFFWTISPALFLTIAVHFIDQMTEFHMYGICLMVFQSVLVASIVFYIFKWSDCRRSIEVKGDEVEGSICWPFMSWRLIALLMLLGVVSSSCVILLVLSVQFLEVIVALALTFCPVVFIALLNHLNREKKCPLELILIAFVTYIGIILILLPAVIYNDEKLQRDLYTGVGASLGSTLLTWPSSILLKYLRSKGVEDYSQGISAGLFGTILSLIIGFSLGAVNPVRIDTEVWWAIGLVILTFSGTLLALLETKLGFYDDNSDTEIVQKNVSFTRLRVYIFLMSLVWGIFRQIYRHRVPDIFSIFGVTLIVLCIILGIGYQRWYDQIKENQQKIDKKRPFLFIPWIFSK